MTWAGVVSLFQRIVPSLVVIIYTKLAEEATRKTDIVHHVNVNVTTNNLL